MTNNQLKYVILAGLFAIPFTPFIISSSLFFPFITGKAFVFRIIVEIIFACYLILALRDESYRPKFSWVLGTIFIFLIAIGLADIFSENPFKSFWSNYERMEGFITLLHLGAYFLVMGSVLKTLEFWDKLLATSVGASAIMAIYSFLQIAGKIAINQGGVRVDGTLGNAAYLAIYMVFHIFFAVLLFVRFKGVWPKILLVGAALMDLLVLYFTATRGAILGFIGGALMAFIFLALKSEKGEKSRKVAIIGVIALLVFVGLFFVLKNAAFVQKSPVLERFSSLSFSEIKTQGRYYVWPMAIKGFVENPILGWGQESFNFVFNKYYDPRMWSQEPWFDRAHSTPLDWLIAGGALGLLSYALIFVSLIFYIFKSGVENFSKEEKSVMLGLVSAYVFNNLFVFDQISSYILFFTLLAFVHVCAPETPVFWWDKVLAKIKETFNSEKSRSVAEALIFIFTLLVIYFVIYIPWQQNKNLMAVLKLNNEGKVGDIGIYTKPLQNYNMGFPETLEHLSQTSIGLISNQTASVTFKQELFNAIDKAFNKQLEKVPNDARYRLFYGIFLSRFGWYGRAVEQLKEAQKLSPLKQSISFELASNLLLDGKNTEALQVAKSAYESDPLYEEAKIVYGLMLLTSGDQALSQEILEKIPQSKIILDDRYLSVLLGLQQYEKIIEVAKKRIELDPSNPQHWITLTAAYLKAERRQEAIQTLRQIIELDPSFKEQGEYYINEIKAGRNP